VNPSISEYGGNQKTGGETPYARKGKEKRIDLIIEIEERGRRNIELLSEKTCSCK